MATLAAIAMASAALSWRPQRPERGSAAPVATSSQRSAAWIEGRVCDQQGPIAGARVRWKGANDSTTSGVDGRFQLAAARSSKSSPAPITASKQGYFIGSAAADAGDVSIRLTPLPAGDNAGYQWVDPAPHAAQANHCGNCHPQIYDEWQRGGHAHSATNRRFLDLYGGTSSPSSHGDWNLLAELPHGAAVCASCHAPTVEFGEPASEDLRLVEGTSARGVHCDFCHKVQEVAIDPRGLTHGRFAMQLLRPREGQLFFGPLDDVDRGEDAYSAVQQESRYCAACHEGTLFGVHVYQTYSEWLASPARREGKQCQSCHMAPDGALTNIAPEMGGIERDPQTLASHDLFPGGQLAMLRGALEMEALATSDTRSVTCQIELVARLVGHRLPSGFVDRHLILVVEALDRLGNPLAAEKGDRLPAAAGDLAGQSGKLFGRLLHDDQGKAPVPFWRAAGEAADTRLHPEHGESLEFVFPSATARVRVRLIYRRFWQEVAQAKGWAADDLVVFDRQVSVEPAAQSSVASSAQ
jgi:hypothetical protein